MKRSFEIQLQQAYSLSLLKEYCGCLSDSGISWALHIMLRNKIHLNEKFFHFVCTTD